MDQQAPFPVDPVSPGEKGARETLELKLEEAEKALIERVNLEKKSALTQQELIREEIRHAQAHRALQSFFLERIALALEALLLK